MSMTFCGSGHAVVSEDELMQNGMCVMCDGAEMVRLGPAFTARAPRCPRCGHGLPFRGFTFQEVSVNLAEDGSTATVQARPVSQWGACRNHRDGVSPQTADAVYDAMTNHGGAV